MDKKQLTFSERINGILGDVAEDDIATITLVSGPNGTVVVRVALSTDEDGVLRACESIPANKLTPHRLVAAAESAYSTLTSAVAVFAASTTGFEE